MELLLVEDETGIRDALSSFLRMQGIEVDAAANVSEALELLAQKQVYCLVSDQHLPDGTGCDLIDRFLEIVPDGHALLSTANPSRELEEWLQARDCVMSMPKPLRPARLLAWITERHELAVAGKQEAAADDFPHDLPWEILHAAKLGSEERDRCMIALLPFVGIAKLESIRREGSRIRLILDLEAKHASRIASELITSDCRKMLDRLGVDFWRVDRESSFGIHVLVSMPWMEAACLSKETLDLSGSEHWGLTRLRDALERAKKDGKQVVNLASWQRTGLELLGDSGLIPDLIACKPKSDCARYSLWTDGATNSPGMA